MARNETAIASTIWRQIGVYALMSVGARNPVATESPEGFPALQFKVGGRMRYMEIALAPTDTYIVRYMRIKARTYQRVTLYRADDIYADQLSEIVDGAYRAHTSHK